MTYPEGSLLDQEPPDSTGTGPVESFDGRQDDTGQLDEDFGDEIPTNRWGDGVVVGSEPTTGGTTMPNSATT